MTTDAADSPFIIRAADRQARADARAIVAWAETEAARLLDEARVAGEDGRAEARLQGLQQGLAEAAILAANTTQALDLFWSAREAELRDVALAVAHRVLASLPADDVMVRLASEAIAEHGRDMRLALRTSPEMADRLRLALQAQDAGDRVTVVGDPGLSGEACTLVHPRGRTEIGLLAQFRAMMAGRDDPAPETAS